MKYLKKFLLPNKFLKKSFNFRQSLHQILKIVWNFNLWTKDDSMSKTFEKSKCCE